MNHLYSADSDSCTVFTILSVEPDEQSHVVDLLTRANEQIFSHIPGFLGRSVYKSLDGRRIITCAEWSDPESFQALFQYPAANAHLLELSHYADPDNSVCRQALNLPHESEAFAEHSSEVFIG